MRAFCLDTHHSVEHETRHISGCTGLRGADRAALWCAAAEALSSGPEVVARSGLCGGWRCCRVMHAFSTRGILQQNACIVSGQLRPVCSCAERCISQHGLWCCRRRVCSMPSSVAHSLGPGVPGSRLLCLGPAKSAALTAPNDTSCVRPGETFFLCAIGPRCWSASPPLCWQCTTRSRTRPRTLATRRRGASSGAPPIAC